MKLLNPSMPKQTPRVYPAEPARLIEMDVGDAKLRYDDNDASLYLIGDEESEPKPSSGSIQPTLGYYGPPVTLCLCVSDECNLQCDYCYVWPEAHTSAGVKTMSEITLVRAIDLLVRPMQQLSISFFGGEPTLAWQRVKFGVERIDHLASISGVRVQYHITTNATNLNEDRARFLQRHGFGVIASVDGNEDQHNRHRKMRNGQGSYADTIRGLELLSAAGVGPRVTLRGTFVPGEWNEIIERLDALDALCERGLGGGISLEPATLCEMDCSFSQGNYKPDEMMKFVERGTDWAIARARVGKPARWAYLTKMVARMTSREICFTECGAGVGYLSVSPDGEIHACHKRCDAIGHVRWGIDEIARRKWLDARLITSPTCSACWARRLCGGGCRAFNLKLHGDLHKPAEIYCQLARAKIRAAARVLYEFRDDPKALSLIGGSKCESDCCAKPAE